MQKQQQQQPQYAQPQDAQPQFDQSNYQQYQEPQYAQPQQQPQYAQPQQQPQYAQPVHAHQQPMMNNMPPVGEVQTGKWEVGLCGCFTHCVPNCCMVYWLPCISVSQIMARIGMMSYKKALMYCVSVFVALYILGGISYVLVASARAEAPSAIIQRSGSMQSIDANENDGEALGVFAKYGTGVYILSTISSLIDLGVIFCLWQLRQKIRTMFSLPGNCCTDCLVSFCCACCSIAQMATHVKSYTPGSCSFDGPDVLQGYTIEKKE